MTLDSQIEAILFFKGEPVAIKKLAEILAVREDSIKEALKQLAEKLTGRGLTLIENAGEVMLGTAAEASELIEGIKKEELSKDLGKAALETLSIVLYHGPISRPDIDYIRGVNSSFILRNLMVRGLAERLPNPNDTRSFLYRPTFDLLQYLGVTRVEDLPEFESVRSKVEDFIQATENENNDPANK